MKIFSKGKRYPSYFPITSHNLTGCNWSMQIRKSIRLDPLFNKALSVKLPADLSTASSTNCLRPSVSNLLMPCGANLSTCLQLAKAARVDRRLGGRSIDILFGIKMQIKFRIILFLFPGA